MNPRIFALVAALLCVAWGARAAEPAGSAQPTLYTGIYESGTFQSLTFLNPVVGWDRLVNLGYIGNGRIIANVEAGLIWGGHEVFNRPSNFPDAVTQTVVGTGALNEVDFHATMVGHVLAGTGYVTGSNGDGFTYVGLGMAPAAQLWSGAIATSYSPTQLGSFDTTTASTVSVYRTFFQGITTGTTLQKPDVINSSWGGSDPTATSDEMLAIDGLARQNNTVAFVASAGNSGTNAVSAPGSTYNGITVGSLGGSSFLDPSTFSSSGPVDFYNPVTHQTLTGVRAAVDIAAPGENLVLAAYLGATGSLGASTDPLIAGIVQTPSPTDRYFLNQAGTSFAAPMVAGGIALLKDAAPDYLSGIAAANDTRVIKSVLMAGATATTGWNNGQAVNGQGVIVTTQALDYATGAGGLNLNNAVDIYLLSGTRDVAGLGGGTITSTGWDFGDVALSGSNDYRFDNPFDTPVELTVSLNWFAGRSFDNTSGVGEDLSFADLNLEVWQVLDGVFSTLLAESNSVYNNAEFLRVDLPTGQYGLRIKFNGLVYEAVAGSITDEQYGLAWRTRSVPEPSTLVLLAIGGALLAFTARRRSAR